MLKEIIEGINCNIASLGIVSKIFGLCEMITDQKLSFPAEYKGAELKKIHDIDITKGVVYHRIRSSYQQSNNDDESTTGCDRVVERNYPMRCVGIIRKDQKKDNAYTDELVSGLIANKILINNDKSLRVALKLDSVESLVTSVNTNRIEVFAGEFKNIDQFIDFEYSLFSIDYNLIISADLRCFINC